MLTGNLSNRTESPVLIDSRKDITQHEIAALKTQFNVADAHTHQSQSPSQREIVRNLPALWYEAENQTQYESEQEFIQTFYRFLGQHRALERRNEIYLVYAASIGMFITATYLQQKKMRVGLIEPCFDNLHDLIKHMRLPMIPLPERVFEDRSRIYNNLVKVASDLDVITLVDPNNPTGFSLFHPDEKGFLEVVRFCVDHKKLLVLDFCFSAFLLAHGLPRLDVYNILEDSGVSYIAMEDTGKTWPLQDAKCATLMTSRDINHDVYQIVTSVLLNVSPFILKLVTSYIRDSEKDNFQSVREVLTTNLRCARENLEGTILRYCEPMVNTSVGWFEIRDPKVSADELQAHLLKHNVYVLSGKYFYWHDPELGQRFIRVALARKPEVFTQTMVAMRDALGAYNV